MSEWHALRATLDAAAERGEAIRFWWRDDDAGRDHPALLRLLTLAEEHRLAIALAVVPAWLEAEAQALIAASGLATVLQHGFAHVDHAPAGAKAIELGARPLPAIEAELRAGHGILLDAFGETFLAVLVPPWNRIAHALVERLAACGFVGLSTFGRRTAPEAAPGLRRANCHLDPVDWRGSRLFVGESAALAQLLAALDGDEPIGLLSHHLVMDEPGWSFLDRLLDLLARHPGARWCSARDALASPP
jgi:hypothetical protein